MVRSPLLRLTFVLALTSFAWLSPGAVRSAETVLLDFTSEHCGPCRQMDPVLKQLAQQGWTVRAVDVMREPKIASQYRVESTPTFIVLVDGREWARLVGGASLDKMVEMLQKANSLAAQYAARTANVGAASTVGLTIPASANAPSPQPTAVGPQGTGPEEGRVVPITDPFAVRTPRAAAGAGGAGNASPGADRLMAATVRLSITDPDGRSTGTGAIVDARNGMALVITCGHLFRESKGSGAIEISLFTPGPNGAEVRGKVAGELLAYDLERDLAFVRFRTTSPMTVTPVAPPGTQLAKGAAVTSVGCDHGANPTAWSTRITAIDRYQGHPNVEAAGAPVEGRSGGGLFNAQGQLIGVCFAADHEGDEGLYSSLASIHAKLDELRMSVVYQSPGLGGAAGLASQTPPADQIAANSAEAPLVRGQNPAPARSLPGDALVAPAAAPQPIASPPGAPTTALAALTPEERATLEEIARRSGGAEVICIIRPQSPDGRSDVIKLSGVSPAFVRALTSSANHATTGTAASAASAASAAAPMATAAAPGGYTR